MGGVLVDLYTERCIEAYRSIAGFSTITEYLDPCHQQGFMKDAERGTIGFDEFVEKIKLHSAPGTTTETILKCHRQFYGTPEQKVVRLIRELSQKYDLYVLSNNNPLAMSILYPLFAGAGMPFETSFKGLFLSYEMHLLKPGAEIFQKAMEASGYKPEEILFIDDSPSNVQGAAAVGMHSALFKQGSSLRALVKSKLG